MPYLPSFHRPLVTRNSNKVFLMENVTPNLQQKMTSIYFREKNKNKSGFHIWTLCRVPSQELQFHGETNAQVQKRSPQEFKGSLKDYLTFVIVHWLVPLQIQRVSMASQARLCTDTLERHRT